MNAIKLSILAAVAVLFSGCRTGDCPPGPGPGPMSHVARRIVGDMVTDPVFKEYYKKIAKRAKTRGTDKPTITVGDLEVNERGYSDYMLSPLRDDLLVALRKTGYFSVKDSDISESADFVLSGKMGKTPDGKVWRVKMSLHDIARDNEEVWNNIVEIGEN